MESPVSTLNILRKRRGKPVRKTLKEPLNQQTKGLWPVCCQSLNGFFVVVRGLCNSPDLLIWRAFLVQISFMGIPTGSCSVRRGGLSAIIRAKHAESSALGRLCYFAGLRLPPTYFMALRSSALNQQV